METTPSPLGVDVGGADSSAVFLLKEISRCCRSLPLVVYAPFSQEIEALPRESHHQLVLTRQEVFMTDRPRAAFLSKRDSTLCRGLYDLKRGVTRAFLSLANTGALVLSASAILGRAPSVHCPALVGLLPSITHDVVLLDLGASPKESVERFQELVFLGSVYAKSFFSKLRPRLGLLNIGHEAMKGTEILRTTDALLKSSPSPEYEYVGFIEPIDIFQAKVDVAITDGFTGNVLLKTAEGVAELLRSFNHTISSPRHAARLFGVNGIVYKCHGRTSPADLVKVLISQSHNSKDP